MAVHEPDIRLVEQVDVVLRVDCRAWRVVVVQPRNVRPLWRPRSAVIGGRLQIGGTPVGTLAGSPPDQVVGSRRVVASDRLDVTEAIAVQPQRTSAPLVRVKIGSDPPVQTHPAPIAAIVQGDVPRRVGDVDLVRARCRRSVEAAKHGDDHRPTRVVSRGWDERRVDLDRVCVVDHHAEVDVNVRHVRGQTDLEGGGRTCAARAGGCRKDESTQHAGC